MIPPSASKQEANEQERVRFEAKVFLYGYGLLIVGAVVFRFIIAPLFGGMVDESTILEASFDPLRLWWIRPVNGGELTGIVVVSIFFAAATKLTFIYLVFRLSRTLRQSPWLTLLYCLLAPFSVFFLIPLVGLLMASSKRISRAVSNET